MSGEDARLSAAIECFGLDTAETASSLKKLRDAFARVAAVAECAALDEAERRHGDLHRDINSPE